jgi:glucose-1-phosphate cytidylyltransferase
MKVVIFAGGLGTRLMEETEARPKPMVEIGGKPILWHIMKIYEKYGHTDFVLCLGYKAQFIKQYFLNYFLYNSDVTIELEKNKIDVHFSNTESFKVTLADTGLYTNTAGRLKQVQKYLNGERFMLTYGDGVSNVNIDELIQFHEKSGKLVTLTSVKSPGRFGNLDTDSNGTVIHFEEKPAGGGLWINGGFFVMENGIFEYLDGEMDNVQFEKAPLAKVAGNGQLASYRHHGFWKCMDALRDKIELEHLWESNQAAWKIW